MVLTYAMLGHTTPGGSGSLRGIGTVMITDRAARLTRGFPGTPMHAP